LQVFCKGSPLQIRFGPFTLDLDTRQLIRTSSAAAVLGRGEEVHLSPKAFDLLSALAQERPKVLPKEKIHERLWPETFVAEANLTNLVAEVRDALGDGARAPRYIRTVHRIGYAFCADATVVRSTRDGESTAPVCWIAWGERRFPLGTGAHIIGREPDVDIRVDAATVSRRHARLVVAADGVTLEDLGSKNGTFREGAPVAGVVALADGDSIGIGSLLLTFRLRGDDSTETLGWA
jgi:DNA-binding winged helix-turn-helix (wHTH) protein